uniref:Uncharacterized protein n=1 Tax=Arundo donax TaxID=35708 RepID=A0A0A9A6R8_ARUDO
MPLAALSICHKQLCWLLLYFVVLESITCNSSLALLIIFFSPDELKLYFIINSYCFI